MGELILGSTPPDKIFLGANELDKSYLGAEQVWPLGVDRGDYIDSGGKTVLLNLGSSQYMNRVYTVSGDRRNWTFSCWIKRWSLSTLQAIFTNGTGTPADGYFTIRFEVDDTITFVDTADGGTNDARFVTDAVYRDVGRAYHIKVHLATANATADDRLIIEVDGVRQTGTFTTPIIQSAELQCNRARNHAIGVTFANFTNYANEYISDVYFIDGLGLPATDFGRFSADVDNWWVPKTYTGGYGVTGAKLDFSADNGADSSGNGNDWNDNNAPTYSFDVPGDNFAVLNSLGGNPAQSATNGNLNFISPTTIRGTMLGTIPIPNTGKWAFQITPTSDPVNTLMAGVLELRGDQNTSASIAGSGFWGIQSNTNAGGLWEDGVSVGASGALWAQGHVLIVYVDMDAHTLGYSSGGVDLGVKITGLPTNIAFCASDIANNRAQDAATLFKEPFDTAAYPPEYIGISSSLIPVPAVLNPQEHANILLYTGDGVNPHPITGAGFAPDFVWMKDRDVNNNNVVYDSVRGVEKEIQTDTINAESAQPEGVLSFDSDGWTVGSKVDLNANGDNFWSFPFLAGGAPVANNDGNIPAQVSANQLAGCSVVTYQGNSQTGQTIGHGLGRTPDMVMCKAITSGQEWSVYHRFNDKNANPNPASQRLVLNTTAASVQVNGDWDLLEPDDLVFHSGGNVRTGGAGIDYIAYCFVFDDVFAGGSYVGNGNVDGVFIPSDDLLMAFVKSLNTAQSWILYDQERSPYNPADLFIRPDLPDGELGGNDMDILSNGIKARTAAGSNNANTIEYIYFGIVKKGLFAT